MPHYVDHIIVVDDASEDKTSQIARSHQETSVHIVTHHINQGVGAAIVSGYKKALLLDVDAVVVVGADAQMDPNEMCSLLDPLVEDTADYVKGDRLGHPDVKETMPTIRFLGNTILTAMTRLSTGYRDMRDSQCGYTAINTEILARLPLDDLYPRYGFPNDMLAKLAEIDAIVMDCPTTPIYGNERSDIRISRVIYPILRLLIRSGIRRWLRQRMNRKRLPPKPHSRSKSLVSQR